MVHHKKDGVNANISLCLSQGLPQVQAISRSDKGPSPGHDGNAVLKCQLGLPPFTS